MLAGTSPFCNVTQQISYYYYYYYFITIVTTTIK